VPKPQLTPTIAISPKTRKRNTLTRTEAAQFAFQL
jgi:hypothetical protein